MLMKLTLRLLKQKYGVCKLNKDDLIPSWAQKGDFYSVTKTSDELSVVCLEENIPMGVKYEGQWRIFKIEGPLDFSLIGILSTISGILAEKSISIFAVSTYDTDYILLKDANEEKAVEALTEKDYEIIE